MSKSKKNYLHVQQDEEQLLLLEIRKAHLDWITAQNMFDFVVEPDDIDHVIYLMNAAEKKYMTLYKRAKQNYLSENGY